MSVLSSRIALPLPPAPGAEEHPALELANSRLTLPAKRVVDALETPEASTAWLVDRGLTGPDQPLQDYCASRLTGLRTRVRELLRAHTVGGRPDPAALAAVNDAMRLAATAQPVAWDERSGLHRVQLHSTTLAVEHAMAQLADDAAALLTGPDAELLVHCEASSCNRFLLRTHARRQWCSTRCGDRVRAARAYARRTERAAVDE
ncbi:hypothetical protein GCM10007147_43090 [Nocardiopsis kunsanensis]|uniref:Zinc finger CGNR domain-containing protein n=1 Tax=Nocardiopsis kunsanensis TaxID=141693 RepID=A0A919CLI4_9ACTN|nr:ABATE domain-containing protein [Nocardiopsis kunsanensis]GHD36062.1 hypothetical protein GCM10007147_43090 [Nocardiopsis kunsanensis]